MKKKQISHTADRGCSPSPCYRFHTPNGSTLNLGQVNAAGLGQKQRAKRDIWFIEFS